ncbi:MAG: hypothetical protein ACRDAX_01005, partial [Propionibacteriaceae bacterium]
MKVKRALVDAERDSVQVSRAPVDAQRVLVDARRAPVDARRAPVDAQRAQVDARCTPAAFERASVGASRLASDAKRAPTDVSFPLPQAQAEAGTLPVRRSFSFEKARDSSLLPPTSPVSEEEVSDAFVEVDEEQQLAPVSTDYKVLTRLLQSVFADTFQPEAPRTPPSQFSSSKAAKISGFVRMKKSLSTKQAFRKVHDWMEKRKASGKTSFALPPSRLGGKAGMWYETGENVGVKLPASAQGDFGSIVDATRRSFL